ARMGRDLRRPPEGVGRGGRDPSRSLSPRVPSGQKELAVPGDHRAGAVVLPGDDANVGDAAPELEDLGARAGRQRARRAQVIDAEGDGFRHAFTAAVVEQPQQRREFEEGAENAAVHGGKDGVSDDLVTEGQDALEGAVAAFDLDAQEARVGDGLDDSVHWPPPVFTRTSRSNEPSLRLAPSMKVPRAL